jgi:hypothetical protein
MTRTEHDLGIRDDDLRHHLDRWAQQGLLTPDQVEKIIRAEEAGPPPSGGDEAGPPARSGNSLVVEALAYLGGVLALAAALLLVQMWWHDLSTGLRLAVPLSAAVSLLLAGLLVPGEAAERVRLRSVLWLLGTGAWAAAVAVFGDQVLDAEPRDTVLMVGLAGVAVALPLYLRARTAAQQLGLFVTLAMTAAAVGLRAGWDEPTLAGLGVWLVALTWFVLGERRVLLPSEPVRYTAAIALVVGTMMMQGALGGQVLALVTIALLVTWGVRRDSLGLLAVACVGALEMIPSAVTYFFPDGGRIVVPLALLAVGSVLVATAVTVTRRRARRAP